MDRRAGGRRGASLVDAARAGHVLRSLTNTQPQAAPSAAAAAACESALKRSGTKRQSDVLCDTTAASRAVLRRASDDGTDAGTSDDEDGDAKAGGRREAQAAREDALLRSPGTPSKSPWLEPRSLTFPFTADGGRRAVEAGYCARLPCCPYTALDALHFSTYTRQLLVDWMVAVSTRWTFEDDTLHLALRLIDDYLRTKRGGVDAFLCWMLNEAADGASPPQPPRASRAPRLAEMCAFVAKAATAALPSVKKKQKQKAQAPRASIGSVGAQAAPLVLAPCGSLVMPALCDCLPPADGTDALAARHCQLLCPPLRCLAVTCLHLAAKHNEKVSRLPQAAGMAAASEVGLFNSRCMSRLEALVLTSLNFTTLRPIPTSFASAYLAMMPALHAADDAEYPLGSALEVSAAYLLDIALYASDALAWPPSMVAAACVSLALRMAAWSMFRLASEGRMPVDKHDAAQGVIRGHAAVLFSATGYGSQDLLPVLRVLQRAVADARSVTEAGGMRGLLTRYSEALVRDYAIMADALMQADQSAAARRR